MALTPLPPAPTSSNPTTFNAEADAFMLALVGMVNEINGGAIDLAGGSLDTVLGIVPGTVSAPGLFVVGDTNTGVYQPAADQLALTTGGTQRQLINSSGLTWTTGADSQAKLGATANMNLLTLNGNISLTTGVGLAGGASGNNNLYAVVPSGGGFVVNINDSTYLNLVAATSTFNNIVVGTATEGFRSAANGGFMSFYESGGSTRRGYIQNDYANSRMIWALENGSTAFRWDVNSVNLATLNTTSMSWALPQNGASSATLTNSNAGTSALASYQLSNGTSSLQMYTYGTGYTPGDVRRASGGHIRANGVGGLTLGTGAAQPIYFAINDVAVARFDTSGRFMLNATSAPDGAYLSSTNSDTSIPFKLMNTSASFATHMIFAEQQNGTPANYNFLYMYGGGESKFYVTGSGSCGSRTNTYGAISMREIKFDERPASSQWSDVKRLGAAAENYVLLQDFMENGDNAKRHLGIMTDRAKKISPFLVQIAPNGEEMLAYSIAYMKGLVATSELLTWADDDVKPTLEDLKRRVAALEQRAA